MRCFAVNFAVFFVEAYMSTLPVFNGEEYNNARIYLATQVAGMMGRKFEEGDWAKVYCAAKGIPLGSWSNLDIDVTHGNLGVEQKMICRQARLAIKEACGTSIMHPAGTRAIRIPAERDATLAARHVLRQYVELIDRRTRIVGIVNGYHHSRLERAQAIEALERLGFTRAKASSMLPFDRVPVGPPTDDPDMRMGWLLWQDGLREFLYFEVPMGRPNPDDYIAEWRSSGGGRRRTSRNLWVYNQSTGTKEFSITTEAGAKIQPYFDVPLPTDPNLYHFVVQGEDCGDDMVRIWLTKMTADMLRDAVGDLVPDAIKAVVDGIDPESISTDENSGPFGALAVDLLVPAATYRSLKDMFKGVSDEHTFKMLVDVLRSRQ